MAKKEPEGTSRIKRLKRLIPFVFIVMAIGWGVSKNEATLNWIDNLLQYVDNRDIVTFEARFLPEQIIETHRQELLSNGKQTLQNTPLKYYPYLLLDVKYPDELKTREGVLLWGLNDGEMVINTETWDTTHGFRDCLECKADRNDFRILQTLAKRQGTMSAEELQKELHLEQDTFRNRLEAVKRKHLVVQKGNLVQLHFENPKLLVSPQTKIKQQLVSKPLGNGKKTSKAYNRTQIMNITQAAFGNDFTIRNDQEVFLPVYSFEILNPDGSIHTSEWNALTGERIVPHYIRK